MQEDSEVYVIYSRVCPELHRERVGCQRSLEWVHRMGLSQDLLQPQGHLPHTEESDRPDRIANAPNSQPENSTPHCKYLSYHFVSVYPLTDSSSMYMSSISDIRAECFKQGDEG